MNLLRSLLLPFLLLPCLVFSQPKIMKSCSSDQCSQQRLCKFPVVITESGSYLVDKPVCDTFSGPIITICADDVTLTFCNGAFINVFAHAIGIKVKGNNVEVIGAEINGKRSSSIGIVLATGIENWKIDRSIFNDFSQAILADDFKGGTLTSSIFNNCDEGFKQTKNGVAEKLFIGNIRADNEKAMNNFSTESYAVTLNGEVIDSTIEDAQLFASSIYCLKCRNCLIEDVEIFYPSVATPLVPGIQCGGPRGSQLLNFFDKPVPPDLQQGCLNCQISRAKVTLLSTGTEVFFPIGIASFYCESCEIVDSQVHVDGGLGLIDGIGVVESYCKNCTIQNCQVGGSAGVGIFVCDLINQCQFCFGTRVLGCEVRNCWLGIQAARCHAPIVEDCIVQQCVTGIIITEGATNALVRRCNLMENSLVGLANAPFSAGNIGTIFPPTSTPDPCPAPIQDPVNSSVIETVFTGNTTDIIDQIGDLNQVNNFFF